MNSLITVGEDLSKLTRGINQISTDLKASEKQINVNPFNLNHGTVQQDKSDMDPPKEIHSKSNEDDLTRQNSNPFSPLLKHSQNNDVPDDIEELEKLMNMQTS